MDRAKYLFRKQKVVSESKENRETSILEAMDLGEKEDWAGLLEKGIQCPFLMDRICSAFYRKLPDNYKYTIPVIWFFNGGRCADSVLQALKKAKDYKPEDWIGKNFLPESRGFDVYIGTKSPIDKLKYEFAWTKNYTSAYMNAEKIGGRIFRGYLLSEDVLAIDANQTDGILQFASVKGIEQIFPKIPVNLI